MLSNELPDLDRLTPVGADAVPVEHRGLVERALLIRAFESTLLELFAAGKLNGTVHTCVGQEFAAVAVAAALRDTDLVVSNHRGHGHYLAVTPDVEGLLAEVMGRIDGVCRGVGGSQHLLGPQFLSSGIQAGMTPIAVGAALAMQRTTPSHGIVVSFIGDGTLGEGLLYESLNLASLWQTPVLFVVENNHYAQSTATSTTIAGSVRGRAAAFDLAYHHGTTWDWIDLVEVAANAVGQVRQGGGPAVLQIDTYRLNAHSKGDDNRDDAEVAGYWECDPLQRILASDALWVVEAQREARERIEHAVNVASASPACDYEPRPARRGAAAASGAAPGPVGASNDEADTSTVPTSLATQRHADRIHAALGQALRDDARVILLGEDIEGPYGGAFRITRELSLTHPGRVINTPISEAAIVGVGTGLALRGMLPIVEIMFGDFLSLAFDQLQQHASKLRDMYGDAVRVPLVVRTPMGGRRGYGPTHSQSIEKHFLGIAGLQVIALNNRIDPAEVYANLLAELADPTLVIENKTLYTRFLDVDPPAGFEVTATNERFPTVRISPIGTKPEVTLLCYGGMLEEAEKAQAHLFDEHEIVAEIVCPVALHPLGLHPIAQSVAATGALVVVEEGPDVAGFGAEAIAALLDAGISFRAARAGYNGIIPASAPRERELLVDAADIVALTRGVLDV